MRSSSGSGGGGGTDSVWMNSNGHNHWKQQQHHHSNSGDKASGASDVDIYAEVGDCDVDLASGFGFRPNNASADPAPYATTTLAMQNKMRTLGGQTFVSLPQQGLCCLIQCLRPF